MTRRAGRLAVVGLGCAVVWLAGGRPAPAQAPAAPGSLVEARRLFADAAYEPALAVLDTLRTSASGEFARDVETARALCLLALGREPEAREALAAVVDLDPLFRFSENDVAPRVVALFAEVRAARLPGAVRQRFVEAREAFGQKDYERATAGFELLRTLLDLPELRDSPEAATFDDMRTLAAGFHDLAVKMLPPPPPPPDAIPPATTPAENTAKPAEEAPAGTRDRVEPPVVLDQRIGNWDLVRRPGRPPYKATVSVVIDETGRVESVRILESNDRFADLFVSTAAQNWRYRPAMRDGVPVKYTKIIAVTEPVR
jgi:TonB family protein